MIKNKRKDKQGFYKVFCRFLNEAVSLMKQYTGNILYFFTE